MEFHLKQTKFLAQKYLDGSQKRKPKTPLLYKRHQQPYRAPQGRETSPLFPDIHSGRQSKSRTTPEGRLQLLGNVDSPGPAAYPPPTINCRESSAPSYTFGWKTPPKDGGGRRSWQKSWFQSKDPFTRKADFTTETNWPSPFDYGHPLGSMLVNRSKSPNFTMGQKREFSFVNKDTVNDPAPNRYNTEHAYKQVLFRSPSIIISPAPQHAYRWAKTEDTPGPAAYNVEKGYNARLPSSPSFYIQGIRRPKQHETGPFSTL